MNAVTVACGSKGRVAYARIASNEDLVQGVEKRCPARFTPHGVAAKRLRRRIPRA